MPDRQGNHVLPDEAKWAAEYSDLTHRPLPTGYGVPLRPKPQGRSLKDVSSGEILFKVGMMTGASAGYFSHVKSNCRLEDDKHMLTPGVCAPQVATGREHFARWSKSCQQ